MSTNGRLHLLQLVHGYPPAIGGVEFAIRDMCERLVADHGFDVTVLTTNTYTVPGFNDASLPRMPIRSDEMQGGVRVLRYPVEAWRSRLLKQPQRVAYKLRLPGNDRLRTWYHGPISPHMMAAVRDLDADVICCASFPLNHNHYPFRRRTKPTPVVLMPSIHTDDDWAFHRRSLLALVNRAYATVARTEHERDWLVAHGAPAERVRVIGHGVDPDGSDVHPGRFRAKHEIDRDAYLVAFVGQHASHKGIDVLIAAFPDVLERCHDAWLVIGGSRTRYTDELERLIGQLPPHAKSRCRLLSNLAERDKNDLLRDCSVLATPSGKEAFGITTLEAWAQRKPVVVGNSPSQSCIVADGKSGLIVPYGDVTALAGALVRLGRDENLRASMGEAGHARLIADFTRSDIERRHAELLAEAAHSTRMQAANT
jgi:glycosyltransferase involved in cell wall biosynthesis